MGIALTPDAPSGYDKGLTQFGQISQDLAGFKIFHNGSGRNNNLQVLRAAAGAVIAGAVAAIFGHVMLLVF